jgi:hypothetical protein
MEADARLVPEEWRGVAVPGWPVHALQKAGAFRHASPIMGPGLDKIHAALALACAAEGDTEAARRHD